MSIWANRPLIRRIENVAATVGDMLPRAVSSDQAAAGERFREALARLARNAAQGSPFWREACETFRDCAASGDPMFFMRWAPIKATMINGTTPFTVRVFQALRGDTDWQTVWKPAITHPLYGHGPIFIPYPWTFGNTVMHAANLRHFQATTGRSLLDSPFIAEFGGGYASMSRLVAKLGHAGRYAIFDLPPVLELQRYYLALHGVTSGDEAQARVFLTGDLDAIRDRLVPGSALMSTWALSEMPLPLRARIVALLDEPRCSSALFAYQNQFEGIDNAAWFAALAEATGANWIWRTTRIDENSDYMTGVRR
jgi:hypothetical protein